MNFIKALLSLVKKIISPPPLPFTGTLSGVTVDVSGELINDEEAEKRLLMARQ
jgi:hypothetical protein